MKLCFPDCWLFFSPVANRREAVGGWYFEGLVMLHGRHAGQVAESPHGREAGVLVVSWIKGWIVVSREQGVRSWVKGGVVVGGVPCTTFMYAMVVSRVGL